MDMMQEFVHKGFKTQHRTISTKPTQDCLPSIVIVQDNLLICTRENETFVQLMILLDADKPATQPHT